MADENFDETTRVLTERSPSQNAVRHPTLGAAQEVFEGLLDPASPENSEPSEDVPPDEVDTDEELETASDEYAEVEESEDNETESVDEEELPPVDDNPLFTVTVDGQEKDVTLDDLRSGYMMQSDYSRKTAVLAEQRRELENHAAALENERNRYANELNALAAVNTDDVEPDWATLKEEDELEYAIKRQDWRDKQDAKKDLVEKQNHLRMEQHQQAQAALASHVETERQRLPSMIPEWTDEKVMVKERDEIVTYAKRIGFSNEELNGLYDSRAVKALRDAWKWHNLQSSQKTDDKKVRNAPKVAKPGTAKASGDSNQKRLRDKRKRLKQSGSVEDAAAVFSEFIK